MFLYVFKKIYMMLLILIIPLLEERLFADTKDDVHAEIDLLMRSMKYEIEGNVRQI